MSTDTNGIAGATATHEALGEYRRLIQESASGQTAGDLVAEFVCEFVIRHRDEPIIRKLWREYRVEFLTQEG